MTLRLEGASERLRSAGGRFPGRPGRPRKSRPEANGAGDSGHNTGIAAGGARINGGSGDRALALRASVPCPPRLLDLAATASYLGVSGWTVRDLEAAGTLRRVRIPLAGQGEVRKLLFDRHDLDRLIEAWKDGTGS